MPIPPPPYKMICPKCKYSKVIKPRSDCLNPADILMKCPKCDTHMQKQNASQFDIVMDDLLGIFKPTKPKGRF